MRATANSRIVSSTRMVNVIRAVMVLILIRARVAPPIKWMSRWPAVMLAVSRTAKAIGWMNRLIVSIITSIGIRGKGVPWGRKWAKDALVLYRSPIATVPAHKGIAIPRFIDSCVVGVNECGNRPRRLVEPINRISDINISAQVCPLWLWMDSICFDVSRTSHCWIDTKRLSTNRLGEGSKMLGNIMINTTIGTPIIVGVIKEVNKLSFIFLLKV